MEREVEVLFNRVLAFVKGEGDLLGIVDIGRILGCRQIQGDFVIIRDDDIHIGILFVCTDVVGETKFLADHLVSLQIGDVGWINIIDIIAVLQRRDSRSGFFIYQCMISLAIVHGCAACLYLAHDVGERQRIFVRILLRAVRDDRILCTVYIDKGA